MSIMKESTGYELKNIIRINYSAILQFAMAKIAKKPNAIANGH